MKAFSVLLSFALMVLLVATMLEAHEKGIEADADTVPFKDKKGRQNLALLGKKEGDYSGEHLDTANASSVLPGWAGQHEIAHLNDALYGDQCSWISASEPSWAEINLKDVYSVEAVCFGTDNLGKYGDRSITVFRILVATEYKEDSEAKTWKKVYEEKGEEHPNGVSLRECFDFEPVQAQWVRIDITATNDGTAARIDELEIYGGKWSADARGKLATIWGRIKKEQ